MREGKEAKERQRFVRKRERRGEEDRKREKGRRREEGGKERGKQLNSAP